MFLTARSTKLATATATAAIALSVAPGSALAAQDLRSPDTRDAAIASQVVGEQTVRQDLRSPDTRDAATASQAGSRVYQDFRSPDTRDMALGYNPKSEPVLVGSPSDDGTDWLPIVFAVIGLAGGVLLLMGRFVRGHRFPTRRPAGV